MSQFPETSYSLIRRVQDVEDGAAWVEFLEIYQPVVYRMARRRGMQDADAHDVVQQIFTSIARSIDRWSQGEGRPPFRAWLSTIARNAIFTALTRRPPDRASGSSSVARLLLKQPSADATATELDAEARRERVRWASEQIRSEFTAQTWDLFWQSSIEGVSIAKLARTSGRTTGAIYVARHRVLARLKEKIAEVSRHWEPDREQKS